MLAEYACHIIYSQSLLFYSSDVTWKEVELLQLINVTIYFLHHKLLCHLETNVVAFCIYVANDECQK